MLLRHIPSLKPHKFTRNLRIIPPHERSPHTWEATEKVNLHPVKSRIAPLYTGDYGLEWNTDVSRILVLKKPKDLATTRALQQICRWMNLEYPKIRLMIEPNVRQELEETFENVDVISAQEASHMTDCVITLGGDGTMLHASTLFRKAVPPILSFSMGTLGFLMSWHVQHYKHAIRQLLKGDVSLLLRMRLACSIHDASGARLELPTPVGEEANYSPHVDDDGATIQVLNEITLHRGRQPHLTSLDLFVNDEPLTTVVADGCIMSTPTGSTAYSLSAGGPIVHPAVTSMICTPICPRSLSFRPILLPPSVMLKARMSEESRGLAEVTIDGRDYHLLEKGQFVAVQQSPFPVPCVNRSRGGVGWVKDIRESLKFNQSFENNVLQQHSETGWDVTSVRPIATAQDREQPREEESYEK